MNVRLNRKDASLEVAAGPEERYSYLVHRLGTIGSGLFPGWGPKF